MQCCGKSHLEYLEKQLEIWKEIKSLELKQAAVWVQELEPVLEEGFRGTSAPGYNHLQNYKTIPTIWNVINICQFHLVISFLSIRWLSRNWRKESHVWWLNISRLLPLFQWIGSITFQNTHMSKRQKNGSEKGNSYLSLDVVCL